MELRLAPTIRVKHYVLMAVAHLLSMHPGREPVVSDPIYYGRMDATSFKTTVLVDGAPVNVLAVFRVQRRTTHQFEIGVHLAAASDIVGDSDTIEMLFDFDPNSEESVREAVISMASHTVFFLMHGHANKAGDVSRVFEIENTSLRRLFDLMNMPSFKVKLPTY